MEKLSISGIGTAKRQELVKAEVKQDVRKGMIKKRNKVGILAEGVALSMSELLKTFKNFKT